VRAGWGHAQTFKIYNILMQLWFDRKRTAYVSIVRGRSIKKEIIAEFTSLGSLDVQTNKKWRVCSGFWIINLK
jgi:hypothetical protein